MDRQELRAVQDPLKARYREDGDTALVTLRAGIEQFGGARLRGGDEYGLSTGLHSTRNSP